MNKIGSNIEKRCKNTKQVDSLNQNIEGYIHSRFSLAYSLERDKNNIETCKKKPKKNKQ